MTRKEMYTAITNAGIMLHPCNTADTAPTDADTTIYYLDIDELTAIYADITAETETTTPDNKREERKPTVKKINNHGIPMKGIRKAASETRHASPYRAHIQISYDTESGEIITAYHASDNNWTEYHDPAIMHVINAHGPMTMQQIADAIQDAIVYTNYWRY